MGERNQDLEEEEDGRSMSSYSHGSDRDAMEEEEEENNDEDDDFGNCDLQIDFDINDTSGKEYDKLY